jgi:hypothetical protein
MPTDKLEASATPVTNELLRVKEPDAIRSVRVWVRLAPVTVALAVFETVNVLVVVTVTRVPVGKSKPRTAICGLNAATEETF